MRKALEEIKVLIIEDDQKKREELVEILRDKGFYLKNVFAVGFVESGIELLDDEYPDVVLLDLTLPYNKESLSLKIDNSNKVIKAVERLNAIRNLEDESTGIIIISASIDDPGLMNKYKHTPEVVDFFDKDETGDEKDNFKDELVASIIKTINREFKHECKIDFTEIRNIKIAKLKTIHTGLYKRIKEDLLEEFEKLNNKRVNISRVTEGIIGLSGIIVEDIINLVENEKFILSEPDQTDNFVSVRKRLIKLTGREYKDYENNQKKYEIVGEQIFSRKAAEFATFAYKLRSEALHSKEGDIFNNKVFKGNNYSIEDAIVSISLIMPLVSEYITYMRQKK